MVNFSKCESTGKNQYAYKVRQSTTAFKQLCLLFITAAVLAFTEPALAATAEEYDGPTTYDWITVQHTVLADTSDVFFIVTIPDEIKIIPDTTTNYTAYVEAYNLPYKYAITGNVRSANGLKLVNADTGATIPYRLDLPLTAGASLIEWPEEEQPLAWFAGNYPDIVTRRTESFQISVSLSNNSTTVGPGFYSDIITFEMRSAYCGWYDL